MTGWTESRWRRLALSVSLAGLYMSEFWTELHVLHDDRITAFRKHAPGSGIERLTLLEFSLLGLVFYFGAVAIGRLLGPGRERLRQRLAVIVLCGGLVFLLMAYTMTADMRWDLALAARLAFSGSGTTACVAAILACLIAALIFRPRRTAQAAEVLLIVLLPSALIGVGRTVAELLAPSGASVLAGARLAPRLAQTKAGGRVIWMVFDEFDPWLAISRRPRDVNMPNLDSLMKVSLSATSARQASDNTDLSIPSMVTGRRVSGISGAGTEGIQLLLEDSGEWCPWRSLPTAFDRFRAQKFNTAVTGWHHPYCRVLNDRLSACEWEDSLYCYPSRRWQLYVDSAGVTTAWFDGLRRRLDVWARVGRSYRQFSGFDRRLSDFSREAHQRTYAKLRESALGMLRDRELGFVYLHLPVPHPPAVGAQNEKARDGYLNNLMLLDGFLGEVQRTLEETGDWEDAVVLITSDHPLRGMWEKTPEWSDDLDRLFRARPANFKFVPFLVKLPRQRESAVYEKAFSTILSGDLLLAAATGELPDYAAVAAWLDARREQ